MRIFVAIVVIVAAGCETYYCPHNDETVERCAGDYRAVENREDFDRIDEECIDAIRKSESWCDRSRDDDRETRHSAWKRTLR